MPIKGWKFSVVVALSASQGLLGATGGTAGVPPGKTVVLGFDGADHKIVERMLGEGKLPNLAKLAASGGFRPLLPTIPAQTPVSWSTFSTGLSPGRTQIFDFLKRDPKSYRPEFAIATEGKRRLLLGAGNPAGGAATAGILGFLLAFLAVRFAARQGGRASLAAGLVVAAR